MTAGLGSVPPLHLQCPVPRAPSQLSGSTHAIWLGGSSVCSQVAGKSQILLVFSLPAPPTRGQGRLVSRAPFYQPPLSDGTLTPRLQMPRVTSPEEGVPRSPVSQKPSELFHVSPELLFAPPPSPCLLQRMAFVQCSAHAAPSVVVDDPLPGNG